MADPYALDIDDTRFRIDINFGDRRRIAVRRRRTNPRALEFSWRCWRRVGPNCADGPELGFGKLNRFGEGDPYVGVFGVEHSAVSQRNILYSDRKLLRRSQEIGRASCRE